MEFLKYLLAAIGAILAVIVIKALISLFAKPAKPNMSKRRIACVGDSITFGLGVLSSRNRLNWTKLLEKKLGKQWQVINYGISGATLQNEGDSPYKLNKSRYYQKARDSRSEIVILMLGTNDSKPQNWNEARYSQQLDEWICDIKRWQGIKQLVLMIPPFDCPLKGKDTIAFDINDDIIREQIKPIMLAAAKKHELPIIDLYSITQGHPEYHIDGVHPNKLGNAVIAEAIGAFFCENILLEK